MSEAAPQSLKNHGRIDPWFHVIPFFFLVANLIVAIVFAVISGVWWGISALRRRPVAHG